MTRRENKSWCIVGGGVLGCTIANRLALEGKDVTLLEAADHIGGLADAWQVGDVVWDRHYHVVTLADIRTQEMLEQLGLTEALRWAGTKSQFYGGGRFHPLNNAIDFLRFPVLGLIDKVRLDGTIFYASRVSDGRALERVPVSDWLIRLSGRRTYDKVWRPLLKAKLGYNLEKASASFIWAIMRRLYEARRSGLKTELFGYIGGGYGRVFERFARQLDERGVRCITNCRVSSIVRAGARLRVRSSVGDHFYDHVVVTAAAPVVTRICRGLSELEQARMNGILYQGVVCASVILRQPLSESYVTYIADENIPFTAVIEMSALVDSAQFNGRTLVYLPCYVASEDPIFAESDESIEARFKRGLRSMYPWLVEEDIEAFRISRCRHVLPVSTLNYSDKLPPMATTVPGLTVANSAHIVNGTLNVNETLELAHKVADELLAADGAAPRFVELAGEKVA
jgi:protoporphyrinogen oxidase